MKFPNSACVFCVGFLCLTGGLRAETLRLYDDFSSGDGAPGTPLDSKNVGASKVAWEATKNVVLAGGSGVEVTDQGAFVGRVAVPGQATNLTVEAGVYPSAPGEAGPKAWIGVGIGAAKLGNPNFGGLLLLVYPEGIYSLIFSPIKDDPTSARAISLKSGRIASWNPNGMNHLKLVYDTTTGSVSAFANDQDELVSAYSLKDDGHTVEAEFAGFSGFGQSSDVKSVGDFTLSVVE